MLFSFSSKKIFSYNLAYQVNYTYSKSIDIGCSGWYGVEGCSVTDPYHLNNSRGVSGFDLTHVLSVSAIYDLPIGRGKQFDAQNRVLNAVLEKLGLNGLFLARSGVPYNVFVGADVANTGNIGWEPVRARKSGWWTGCRSPRS